MKLLLKRVAIVVVTLALLGIVLGASFIGWLRWSGERDWKKAQAELRAKGEKLTLAELVPPMPPDSENFFADPIWAEFYDSNAEKESSGKPYLPRVPRGQRQLERWQNTPLTSEEKARLSKLMPGEAGQNVDCAFTALKRRVMGEGSPGQQKEMAALLLDILSRANPHLSRIAELSERPDAQFPTRFDLAPYIPLPEITQILTLSQQFAAKSLSEVILGKNTDAEKDTLALLRLTFVERNNPLLIAFLVRMSTVSMAVNSVNEGIVRHAWTDSALSCFQEQLAKMNLRESFLAALRGERVFCNEWALDHFRDIIDPLPQPGRHKKGLAKASRVYVGSILFKDKAFHNIWVQRQVETLKGTTATGWNATSTQPFFLDFKGISEHPVKKYIYLFNVLSIPSLLTSIQKAAECQTQVDQTLIACALERYRIAHGSYPSSLEALVPEYLAKIPNSPITGKPMNYSLKPDGTFLLWTPSWELKSLGGKSGEYSGEGDIVWGQPLPKLKRPQEQSPSRP